MSSDDSNPYFDYLTRISLASVHPGPGATTADSGSASSGLNFRSRKPAARVPSSLALVWASTLLFPASDEEGTRSSVIQDCARDPWAGAHAPAG